MTVVRYQCPACQTLFVPPQEVSPGAYARCPSCGAVSVQARDAEESDPSAETSMEVPLRPRPVEEPSGPAPLFAALLAGEPSVPQELELPLPVPVSPSIHDELTIPPNHPLARALSADLSPPPPSDPDATGELPVPAPAEGAGGGGLFASLLADNAPDLSSDSLSLPALAANGALSASAAPHAEAPAQAAPREAGLPRGVPPDLGPGIKPPPSLANTPFEVASTGMVLGPLTTGEVPLVGRDAIEPDRPPPTPFEVASTGMVLGPVTTGEVPLQKMAPPPVTGSGVYLDKETFSDAEFEALVGGSFAGQGGPSVTKESSGPEGWVVSQPPSPPPLKKARSDYALPAPPVPTASLEPKADPGKLLAGLSPIPTVASLGPVPALMDGAGAVRVALVLVGALLLGSAAGMGLAPPPEKAAVDGTAGARVKVAEAHRLMDQGKDAEALQALETALSRDANLPEVFFAMGVAYARLEKHEEAARAYQTYLELRPRDPRSVEIEASIKKFRAGASKP